MRTLELEKSRTYPVPLEQAFDAVLATPLPELFSRRYAVLPPIRQVRDQDGVWASVGQTRTIVLADGGTMREELTSIDRPGEFRYRITDVTGPMKLLVGGVDGRWAFEPAGTGVRITWAWVLQPQSPAAGLAMPGFARLWQGYARQALDQLEALLVR
jgi:hypothetical protein